MNTIQTSDGLPVCQGDDPDIDPGACDYFANKGYCTETYEAYMILHCCDTCAGKLIIGPFFYITYDIHVYF